MATDYGAQYALLAACFVSGLFFGAACDVVRAFRMLIPHCKVLIFVGDFIFCILCACLLILDFYNFSHGYLRLFGLAAAGIAFLIWRLTVSRLTSAILDAVKRFLAPKLQKTAWALTFAIDFLRGRVYTVCIKNQMRARARRGFGLYRSRRMKNGKEKIPQN